MTVIVHSVKIAPKYFNLIIGSQKTAELRKNDRGYKAGHVLSLCEWKHGSYTGREWAALITHVLPCDEVMPEGKGWAMLSLRLLTPLDALAYVLTGVEQ